MSVMVVKVKSLDWGVEGKGVDIHTEPPGLPPAERPCARPRAAVQL